MTKNKKKETLSILRGLFFREICNVLYEEKRKGDLKMNELICTILVIGAGFIIGGLIFVCDKILPSIKNFIKWQRFRKSDDEK